jgi:hypothetical protein
VPAGACLQVEEVPGFGQLRLTDVRPDRTVIQRVEIDDRTGRAADGKLYGQEALRESRWFAGYVWGPRSILDAIAKEIDRSSDGVELRVGKSRTRGHGSIRVFVRREEAPDDVCYPRIVSKPTDVAGGDGFTVFLYTDLIAVDPLLRPITRIDESCLWRLVGGSGSPPFELARGYVMTRRVAGFNGVPGLPRTSDTAICAGSVWRFRWRSADRTAARSLLQRAQTDGIGLRRGEGFGRIVLNLPIHDIELEPTGGNQRAIEAGLATMHAGAPGRAVAGPPAGTGRVSTTVPPQLEEILRKVRQSDRLGLARVLRELDAESDPVAAAARILEDRLQRRGKSTAEVNTVLRRFADGESVSSLAPAAAYLFDLDAQSREKEKEVRR